MLSAGAVFAQGNHAADRKIFAARAEKVLLEARKKMQGEPTNSETAWRLGSACFDRAEFATNDTERATLAVEGINAMRTLIAQEPRLAAGHYYLGMNLGQLARTKTLGALRIVDEMEREFKAARALDEHFDNAGSDRNLGLLYLEAPGWPASIGNKGKARKHLERAAELTPGYPENHLNLLDAYLKWNDQKGIRREVKMLAELWPAAKTNFTGEVWESCWADWETRWAAMNEKSAKARKSH